MNKRGLIELGALAIILITTIGVIAILRESSHIYVGDKTTKMVYDYKLCQEQIEDIPKEIP